MKRKLPRTRHTAWLLALALGGSVPLVSNTALAQAAAPAPGGDDDQEEVIELSPFTITADDQSGYQATSTLAGTAIKTDLKDVGSAITVVTREFLEDTGATDAQSLLVYTVSTEIGGALGNFTGPGASSDEGGNSNARANPQSNNRVRGLSTAALTRDYFLTAFGFDSYNTEMVTINRGPNSILFGIGEPGGIVENSLKKARLNRDANQLSFRFGQYGTVRATGDFNRVVIDDALALRFNFLKERVKFRQKPSYEDDTRGYLAGTWKVFKNDGNRNVGPTLFRFNYERASIRSSPVNTTPPQDHFTAWWEPPTSPEADAMVGFTKWDEEYRANYAKNWVIDPLFGTTTPGNKLSSQPAIWNSWAIVYANPFGPPDTGAKVGPPTDKGTDPLQVIHARTAGFDLLLEDGTVKKTPGWFPLYSPHVNPFVNHPGWKFKSIEGTDIYDWENLQIMGLAQYANHDFEAFNFSLEQTFFDNDLGFELAYDAQVKESEMNFPGGRAIYSAIRIDASKYLPDGTPNPNVGRPMFSGMWDPTRFNRDERRTVRLKAYYVLDLTRQENFLKYLGHHTFTGIASRWENDNKAWQMRLSWDTDYSPQFVKEVNQPGAWSGGLFYLAYLGDPQFNAKSPSELRLYRDYLRIEPPKAGEIYHNYWYDSTTKSVVYDTARLKEYFQWPGRTRRQIDAAALTLQSRLLDDHLIFTYGIREDKTKTWQIDSAPFRLPNRFYDPAAFDFGWRNEQGVGTLAEADPVLDASGRTSTTQVVLHMPYRWLKWSKGVLSQVSVHWAESENFNPSNLRRNIWGDVIDHPSGETTEKGVTLGFFENKATLRLNWYETAIKNITNINFQGQMWALRWPLSLAQRWLSAKNTAVNQGRPFTDWAWYGPNGVGPDLEGAEYLPERLGPFNSFDEVINGFISSIPEGAGYTWSITGPEGEQTMTFESPTGLSTVADVISDGFEVEMVYNVTPSWRVAFNASKTESVFSNGLREVTPYVEELVANLKAQGMWGMADSPSEGGTVEGRITSGILVPLAAAAAKEGTVSPELRKWRWNLVTNYQFREGFLKGFGLGGSIRWQDKAATGYPLTRDELGNLVPVLENPYYSDTRWNGDVWFSYKTEVFELPVRFQLNLQNYLGDHDPLVVSQNPDGGVAVYRSAPEKRWFFTTTVDF